MSRKFHKDSTCNLAYCTLHSGCAPSLQRYDGPFPCIVLQCLQGFTCRAAGTVKRVRFVEKAGVPEREDRGERVRLDPCSEVEASDPRYEVTLVSHVEERHAFVA